MNDQTHINGDTPIEFLEFLHSRKTIRINNYVDLVFNYEYHFNLVLAVSKKMLKSRTRKANGEHMGWALSQVGIDDNSKVNRITSFKAFRNAWVGRFANQHNNIEYFKVIRQNGELVGDSKDKEGVFVEGDKRREFLKNIFRHNKKSDIELAEFWLPSPSSKKGIESKLSKSKNKLIQVPVFTETEHNNEFVRFVSKTDDLNYEILIDPNGFKILEGKEDLFSVRREIKQTLTDVLRGSQDILIEGHMKVGKTRLVFDTLKDTEELRNSYVFSLYPATLRNIDKLNIADNFNKIKKKKLIWFIDDLQYFFDIGEELSIVHDKLTAKLGKIITVATLRADERGRLPRLLKDAKAIEVEPWSDNEGKEYANHYNLPMSRFAGTAFSLIKDIKQMKRRYDNTDKSNTINNNCRHIMRYLKLLSTFIQFVDYNLLEEIFLYFRKKKRETNYYVNGIKTLESSGFIVITEKHVLSWEPYLSEIVTEKDYRSMDSDLVKVINFLGSIHKTQELSMLGYYFYYKNHYTNSAECYSQIININSQCNDKTKISNTYSAWGCSLHEQAVIDNSEELYNKAISKHKLAVKCNESDYQAIFNWGNAIIAFAELRNNEVLYKEACDKYELAVKLENTDYRAYAAWGIAIARLAEFQDSDDLYNEAFAKFKIATNLKKDAHDVYSNWGDAIIKLAKLQNNEGLFNEACNKYELATKYNKEDPHAYFNWGIVLSHLGKLHKDEKLYIEACSKLKTGIKFKKDHEAYFILGNVLLELATLQGNEDLFHEACSKFETAVNYRKNYHEAYYRWGRALSELAIRQDDNELYQKASEKFSLAAKCKSDFPDTYLTWAITLCRWGVLDSHNMAHFNNAFSKYKLAVKYKENNSEAYYWWGYTLYDLATLSNDTRLSEEACEKFELAVKYEEDYPEAYYYWGRSLGDLAMQDNNKKLFKNACEKFELAIKYRENYSEAYYALGDTLCTLASCNNYNEKQLKHGITKFALAVKYNEDFPTAYYNWGRVLYILATQSSNMEFLEEACEKFELAIKYRRNYSEAYYELGDALCTLASYNHDDEKQFRHGISKFVLAVKYNEDFPLAYYSWGRVLFVRAKQNNNKKLLKEACEKFELAIKYRRNYSEAYYELGDALCTLASYNHDDEKQFRHGISKFALAIKYNENLPLAYCNWGRVLFILAKQNNNENLFKEASAKFELAVKYQSDYAEAYYCWGQALYWNKNLMKNEQNREKVLELLCTSYFFSLMQNNCDLEPLICNDIEEISNKFNSEKYLTIARVFSMAQITRKLSNNEIKSLETIKGKLNETDIVIDAMLEKKKPCNIHISENDFLLKSAVFLANKITNSENTLFN
jgi:tetratricopeptide (TPR) repeat protein